LGHFFLFGSEVKAMLAHPACKAQLDKEALLEYFTFQNFFTDRTLFAGVHLLPAGSTLTVAVGTQTHSTPQRYWDYNFSEPETQCDEREYVEELDRLVRQAVNRQLISDVDVGAYLSGGMDSGSITAVAAKQLPYLKTFTCGFDLHSASGLEMGFDEREKAEYMSYLFKTEHYEMVLKAGDMERVLPRLAWHLEEPRVGQSYPNFYASQLARQQVTVALSGDGGDELFGGYNRYLMARQTWGEMQRLPLRARRAAAGVLRAVSPSMWDRLFDSAKSLLPKRLHIANPGDKAHKLADVLTLADGESFFRQLTSHWQDPVSIVIGGHEPTTLLSERLSWPTTNSFEHWMMAIDAQLYLPDDILVKVDRAAMAVGLETRVPLLDHRVVELAWRMPLRWKIRDGQGKWLLRQVLYRHVPKKLIERPKMGFGIPLDSWLRGPLRDWAESLLDEGRLHQEGYFNPAPIRKKWAEHLSEQRNWQSHLWNVLMFQAWLEEQSH